jgi:hypothetical protein
LRSFFAIFAAFLCAQELSARTSEKAFNRRGRKGREGRKEIALLFQNHLLRRNEPTSDAETALSLSTIYGTSGTRGLPN